MKRLANSYVYPISIYFCLIFFVGVSAIYGKQQAGEPDKIFQTAISQYNKNELDSAQINFRLFISISDKQTEMADQANANLYLADIKRTKQEFDSAYFFLDQAKGLLLDLGQAESVIWADYYHKRGTVLLNQGNYQPAIADFNQSVNIRKNVSGETDTNLVLTYNNLGITSFYLGNFDQALTNYQKAINIISLGEISETRHAAFCYQNTGILFATLGDYQQANHYFSLTQEVFEHILESDDISLGRFYLNFGRMEQLSGQIDNALRNYEKAEEIFQKGFGPEYVSIGVIYLNKASIYNSFTDYERAYYYNSRALAIFQQNLNADHPNISAANHNLGYYFEKKEDYRRAIEYYQKSINNERISQFNVATYRNMANLYSLIEDNEQADKFFNKAIDQSIKIFGADHTETALSYVNYSRFLTRTGKYHHSHNLLHKAKNIYLAKLGPKDRDYSNTLSRIGNNYLETGELIKALDSFQESIIALAANFDEKNPLQNPSANQLVPDQYLLNSLYLKAKTLHELFIRENDITYLKTALETYELSSLLINKIRSAYISNESRLIITGITSEILIAALDCSLDLYRETSDPAYLKKAFEFSEKGKAAVLLSSMNDLEARQLARVPDEIQKFERDLTLSLDSYNQLIHEERLRTFPDENKINLWQSITFSLNQRYDSLINAIYQQYPDYYDLRFDLSITSLSEVQQNLHSNQSLIEYTLSEQYVYVFAITPDTAKGLRFDLPENFQKNLEEFRKHLSGGNIEAYSMSDFNDFIRISHEIYNTLLEPLEEIISGRKIVIIPDNQLGYLPFEVLLTEKVVSQTLDFRNLPYLIKKHPVSYAYSATLLQKKSGGKSKNNGRILAFAPTYSNNGSVNIATSRQENLLQIPWAIDEAKSLAKTYRGRSLTGEEATESRFKEKSSEYLVLHLAMHTLINNENPMFSRLVFSQSPDTLEDGYLNTYELFNLELNAELAVLSACQTGDGRLQRGEGIMSMARGFFYAGVPSIIMTLWEIDDHSSSQLISLFYHHLAQGKKKDEALQAAKLDYLSTSDRLKAHPHYWAGYVSIGNIDPVPLRTASPIWLFATPIALLFVLAVYLSSRKRRNKK